MKSARPKRWIPALACLLGTALLGNCRCASSACRRDKEPVPSLCKFEQHEFEAGKHTRPYPYLKTKTGRRPLLLLHELPGLTPGSMDLALKLEERGYKVYTPKLFGTYGQNRRLSALPQALTTHRWKTLSHSSIGPFSADAWSMIDQVADKHPGMPVTIIGNCFTGTVPLELIAHPSVETAVMCQPALPFWIPGVKSGKAAWPIPQEKRQKALEAMDDPRKRLIFVQYVDDCFAPIERTKGILHDIEKRERLSQVDLILAVERKEEVEKFIESKAQRERVRMVEVCHSACHSTLTGAADPDREKLRGALWEILPGP